MSPSPSANDPAVMRVLLLEDNPDDAALMKGGLADAGDGRFEVAWLGRLSAGLEYLETHAIDVILLDLSLPDSQGAETFERVRARVPAVPVVVLTSLDDQSLAVDLMNRGAQDYLTKGHTDGYLLSRSLRYAVQRRRFQEEMEETLRESDRQKDRFLAVLAHELRNPLAPIQNAVTLMRRLGTPSAEFQWAVDVVGHQVGHMKRLLDDLLDVARVTRGSINLNWECLSLSVIIDHSVEISQPLIDERGHRLTVTAPSDPAYVTGDLTRLSQVLSNLLNNAAAYTPPGGNIALTVEATAREVLFRVRDNGMGIPPEALPHIFDSLAQVHRAPRPEYHGLGLGLTLVRRLVELHSGKVEAYSDGPDRGSEFVVSLPRVHAPAGEQADGAAPAKERREPGPRRRVLVVEDQPVTAGIMAKLLEMEGYQVETANDGPTALEVSQSFLPQAVVLDIGLPGMDGYELARRLRARPETRDARIIALSGYGQHQDINRSQEAGCDGHLAKPVELEVLVKVLFPDS